MSGNIGHRKSLQPCMAATPIGHVMNCRMPWQNCRNPSALSWFYALHSA
jgi:hypothetical protein